MPGGEFSRSEARTLMTVESLVEDRDLDLLDDYAGAEWRGVWDGPPLEPAALTTDGRLHERQGVALPLLLTPGWALGGPTGVRLELCLLLALAMSLAAGLGRRLAPDPMPGRAVLVVGLTGAALGAGGAVSAVVPATLLLVVGARCALAVRESPSVRATAGAALCAAALPWFEPWLLLVAVALALVVLRWLRRRRRGLAGFVGLEVVLLSAVVYVTFNDRLFGGLTPGAPALPGSRAPAIDPLALAVAAPPVILFVVLALRRLVVSRRAQLMLVADDQVDVEVAATFLLGLVAVCVTGAFLSGRPEALVVALGAVAALGAWALPVLPDRAFLLLGGLALAGSGAAASFG